jgi:hypothetical protein
MPAAVVKVVVAIMVSLGKATMIGPIAVAMVMAAVAIEGLMIDVATAFRPRAAEIPASIRPGPGAIVRKSARAARTGA